MTSGGQGEKAVVEWLGGQKGAMLTLLEDIVPKVKAAALPHQAIRPHIAVEAGDFSASSIHVEMVPGS